jgi:alkanesulfonate monooxygenase SsuD/methylene tetrahydromethanopterin reductase-like flavin-dependent oxidoreductase (luciferase family)
MRVDANFYGTVPMHDAGNHGPRPVDRRYGNADYMACYDNLTHWAKTLDSLDFDTMWFTEHHFQYEGYEVIPNQILLGLYLATQTGRLRFGQMFNIVPQWHPLRLAEDYAMADILTGGRLQFGVGRGTVPREAESLGACVASGDNDLSREADRVNREVFEEAMEVILASWRNERFTFAGKHFTFPPAGIPDRGSTVKDLTMIPKPRGPVEVYQAVSSARTLEYVASMGFRGVFANAHPSKTIPKWERFGEVAARHGHCWDRGDGRMLVVGTHIGRTREEAFRTGRNGHDEYCRFLAPYGRFAGYLGYEYETALGFQPTLEQSVEQHTMAFASVADVVDTLGMWCEQLGVRHLCCFFDFPGLTREQMDEQFHLFSEEVRPRLPSTA